MGGSDAILLRFPGSSVFNEPSPSDSIQGGQFKSTTAFTTEQPLLPLLWGVLDQTQPVPAIVPVAAPAAAPAASSPAAPAAANPDAVADPANTAAAPVANSGSSSSPQSTHAVSGGASTNVNSSDSDSNSKEDLIIGFAVIGVIIVLVAIIVGLLCRRRRKRRYGIAISNTTIGQPQMSSVPSGFVGQPAQSSTYAFPPYRPEVPTPMPPAPQRTHAPTAMPIPPPREYQAPSSSYAYSGYSQPPSPPSATRGNTIMSNSTADSSAVTRQNTLMSNSTYDFSAPGRQNTIQSTSTSDTFSARPTASGGPAASQSLFSYAGPHEPKLQDALRRDGFLHDSSPAVPSVSGSSGSGAGKQKAPRAIPTHEVDSGVSQADVDALQNGPADVDVLPPMYDSLVPAAAAASPPARDDKSAFRSSTAAAGGAGGIHPGAVVRTSRAYARQHPDELDLEVGKTLVVTELLQDDRARGFVLGTSLSGIFPLRNVTLVPDAHAQKFFS
ncbi:hypothetical protein HDU89_000017 [Geranomyces variabilis]|nr:hypothetical protein HDU89_000017 [Geranomyces variabilis]